MLKAIAVILLSAAVVGCSSTSPSPVGPWTVTSVSPVRGSTAGGTLLTIVGSGFQSGTTVTIGGVKQVLSSFGGSTVLYLTTTAQEAGIAEMVITGRQGQVERFAGAFEFTPPQTFDFNGSWEGVGTREGQPGPLPRSSHLEIRLAINGDVVTSIGITCDGISPALPGPLVVSHVPSLPPPPTASSSSRVESFRIARRLAPSRRPSARTRRGA
jgi:hypothetical protein